MLRRAVSAEVVACAQINNERNNVLRAGLRQFQAIKSWIVFYTGFMAAIVFAEYGIAMMVPGPGTVSPVLIDADAPVIQIEPVVRRLDI
jgi:hypothetical protein